MVSNDGIFELGFFSPGNSHHRYVGIWYKMSTVRTVVWVANREVPLTNRSGCLKVLEPGLMVLEDEDNVTIWSTHSSNFTARNPVAQLLNSGNFVVKDADDDDSENFIWQSFDYPTDTLLPGMKLGWNYVTNHEVYMSSWKSNDDPGTGDFSYHCEPSGYPQDVMRKDGVVQYKTGPWNGLRFSGVPNLRRNPIFSFGVVITTNEVYYHFELLNSSIISRFSMLPNGVAQRSTWIDRTQGWVVYITAPTDNCDIYRLCGVYGSCHIASSPVCGCLNKFVPNNQQGWDRGDWSEGCVRKKPLDCANGDGFLKYSGIKLPDTKFSWYNISMNLGQCKEMCTRNCSCMAYAHLDISNGGNGCLLWFDDLLDIKELSAEGQDIYIRMASSEIIKGKKREVLILSFTLVMGTILLGISLVLLAWRRKKRQLRKNGLEHGNKHTDEIHNEDLELPLFDLCTITKATENFSFNNKLGEGGFGPVT